MTTIKIKVNDDEEIQVEWKPAAASRQDIDTIAYAVKRKLLEAFGHSTRPPGA
jgi:hypothetical protein